MGEASKRYETSVAQDEEDDEEDDDDEGRRVPRVRRGSRRGPQRCCHLRGDGREAEPEVYRWIKQVQHYLDGPRGEGRIARVDGSHLCVVDWPDGPHQRAGRGGHPFASSVVPWNDWTRVQHLEPRRRVPVCFANRQRQ